RAVLDAEPGVALSISHTTRAPRPGEVDGEHYYFVSLTQFNQMTAAGEFLESAEIYGNRYGTWRTGVGQELSSRRDVLLELDWQGAQQVRGIIPDAVGIFILPPSLEILRARLMNRAQDSADVIARRLAVAEQEMAHADEYSYVIINDDFSRAAMDLR